MNNIAQEKEETLLNYLRNDLPESACVDTSVARSKQMKGIEVFKKLMIMQDAKTMRDINFQEIYVSKHRDRFWEYSRVSLGDKERDHRYVKQKINH